MARTSYQKGSVIPRSRPCGRVYELRWRERQPGGTWKQKMVTLRDCPGERAARRELDRILVRVNARHAAGLYRVSVRFHELLDVHWAQYLDNADLKPSTRSIYASMTERWIRPFFGPWKLEEITPALVGSFFADLAAKKLSPKYRRNLYALVKLAFDIAVENDLVEASPVRPKVHRPRAERREKPSLSIEEARRVLAALEPPWQAPVWTLALTGIRTGELLALRWQDIDFAARRIHIRHSLWRGQLVRPKTDRSVRTLILSAALEAILRRQRESSLSTRPDDFVFGRADGEALHPDTLRRCGLYPAFDRAQVERRERASGCHAFRHLAGSIIHRQTGSLKLAQTQLGHSNVGTTADIYTHLEEDELKRTASILDEVLGNPCWVSVGQKTECTETVH